MQGGEREVKRHLFQAGSQTEGWASCEYGEAVSENKEVNDFIIPLDQKIWITQSKLLWLL